MKKVFRKKKLADRAGLTGPTAHTALCKMEAKGLIEKEVPEGGNSRPIIKLSPFGRSLRDKLEPLAVHTNDTAVNGLSENEVSQLRVFLLKMNRNLTADGDVASGRSS
ncbi:MarR family winged helix-turn-helix transcriptional regulator [Sulfitobacter sp.]|uniref:MarR family winged helix-turn-helix transcriptional regulator n=1 Tax=Sulfitobacter sp. TaxID=1903071 RepID=UPI0030027583